ncbi:MAG: Sensor histidine kinase PrrB (RegB) [Rhodanobacteraceae bacterium]|jgi:two-component system sensor histidine kinase RegB|nr:MAG: Sensor histidine kinase PrrB (RegB) [Rhodanobacteraceae bacterium]
MLRLRTHPAESSRFDARALVMTSAWLRPCDALGQALAVAVAIIWLRIPVPLAPLAAGIAVLILATPVAFWRLRQAWPLGETEAFCHVAFDILLLGWALYFTGGASNPFITLLLVPVALSAAALSVQATASVTALAAAVYGILIFVNVPLPDMPMHGNAFRLHLTGMTVNFMIAILLLAVFIARMHASLNTQREAIGRLRERALRDEGLLAIATQAAEAAHRLNTPLSTLRTLLPELGRGREGDAALRADLEVMTGEVERCRNILREMVEYGRGQLADGMRATTLGAYMHDNADRFRVLRPEAAVTTQLAPALRDQPIEVRPGLAHALFNLMQNALDASRRNGSNVVTLAADTDGKQIEFVIGDQGRGFTEAVASGLPVASSKPDGLGIGLLLTRATVERMHGELQAFSDAEGSRVCVRLPLTGHA